MDNAESDCCEKGSAGCSNSANHTHSVVVTVGRSAGALAKILEVIETYSSCLVHVESRSLEKAGDRHDVCVTCIPKAGSDWFDGFLHQLEKQGATNVRLLRDNTSNKEVPWFPRRAADLDQMVSEIYDFTADPDAAKLPAFQDVAYLKRRKFISEQALKYRHGQPIVAIEYTEEETQTWKTIFRAVSELYPTHACKQHRQAFEIMKSCCGYVEDSIPDLEVASRFLKGRTGFRLRPVAGQMTPRDFLSSLAFRVFCCTQYIRHRSEPFYSPEPDVCHELLGHVPMLSDPAFAEFSQEIGLACLGAPDEYIDKLSSLYWYSIEFGICMESDGLKGYGAGVLSSAAEMKNAIESNEVKRLPFDAHKMAEQKISYVGLQNTYYYPETFEEAMKKIKDYAAGIPRPFQFRYDPYTERLVVMNNREDMTLSMRKIQIEMERMQRVVGKSDV